MAIERFSSRREALGPVLTARLAGAKRYLRIAGYFRSSLLEVVGEALETVGEIRVICNGDLDPHDVKVAKAARDGQAALARTLVSSWQATEDGLDVLLARERYRRLHDLLASGRMKVRVVPRDADNVFVHGKAGVIEHGDGRVYSFVGSVNDSASGFRHAYEILWGDEDPIAATWVREEFEHFWQQGVDLPDAVVKHVAAMAGRIEYRSIEAARDTGGDVATDAILAERPIYKGGQILRSWQKRFVQSCVEDRRLHGRARYLIADDVGLGKTLSMAAAALVLSMLDDKPVLILAPATLIWQWQEELEDKLGVPAAVWSTQKKCWLDGERRPLTQKGDPTLVAKCPWRIGIMSTGLIVNGDDAGERGALAKKSFGVVILDEAHKARASRGQNGRGAAEPNQLLRFLRGAAGKATNVIIGTATPIQLDAVELWDLLNALGQGAPQVLGQPFDGGEWVRAESIRYLTGAKAWPMNDTNRWGLFRNPLPPAAEHSVFRDIRNDAGLVPRDVLGPRFDDLSSDIRTDFLNDFQGLQAMVDWFFENFEDPAHRTPYETAEGGYIWIWGGPYDAADEIGSNFSEEDQELIDEAVERVQHDGIFDWAPTEKPGDYESERDDPEDEPGDGQPPVEDEEEPDGRVSSFEDILATIPPEPSGPVFDRTDQARIDLVDWDGAAAPDGALLSALREQTAELILQLEGTNGHQALLHALIRYSDAVNAVPAPIPRLYIEGVFLENAAAQGDREIVAGDRPPLPGRVPSGLASLHHLHGTLIMSTPTGSAMVEAAERYRATPKDQDRLNQSIKEVAQAIRDTPVVFGPVARQLAEQAASNVGKGERPARSNHAASLLLKRMLAGAGKVVKFAVGAGLLTVVGDGLAATGAGAQAMAGVTALGEAAWSFLVGHVDALRTFAALVGSDLVWLRQLTAWLLSRR